MIKFLAFTLRMLRNQRGEVGDDDPKDDDDDDGIIEIDTDDLLDDDDDDPDKKGDDDKNDDDPDKAGEDFKAEMAKKDELLKKQEETIKEHNRNLYGMRKKFEKLEADKDDKGAKFTDAQLEGMIEEHRDDPKVMLQIMRHISKQDAVDEAKVHGIAAEVSQRKKEMDGYLTSSWPEVHTEGSKDHQDIQQAKDYLHLNDHPLGDFLAGASTMFLQLPEMLETAKKEAREGALKVEGGRKKSIKQNSLETGKEKKASVEMPENYQATVKQLNMSKSQAVIYKQLLAKGKQPATVEV